MSIEISPQNAAFIDAAVASGAFESSAAVVDRAIGLLREREEAIRRILSHPALLPELPKFLVRADDGYVTFRGRRIGLHLVLERYYFGDSATQIQDRFSSLTLDEVTATVALAESHRFAMRAYFDQWQQIQRLQMDDARRGPTTAELQARWQQKAARPGNLAGQ
jgi:Arc/MetJ-type ribon-helix-helix transcriptional regulator